MKFSELLGLRPAADATAATIQAAIDNATAEADRATKAAADAEAQLADLLLEGDEKALERAQLAVDAATTMATRARKLAAALQPKLDAAVKREAQDSVRALEAEFTRLATDLDGSLRKTYPAALAAVTALLSKEAAAEAALRRWADARRRVVDGGLAAAEDLQAPPRAPSQVLGGFDLLRTLIQMPTADGKLDPALGGEGAILPVESARRRSLGEDRAMQAAQLEASATMRLAEEERQRLGWEGRAKSFERPHGPVVRTPRTPVPLQ